MLAVLASSVSFLSRTLDRTYEIEYGNDDVDYCYDDDVDHCPDDDDGPKQRTPPTDPPRNFPKNIFFVKASLKIMAQFFKKN